MPLKKIVQYGRFCAKNVRVRNTYFHFGIPSHPDQVVSLLQIIYQEKRYSPQMIVLFKFFENLL